LCGLLALLRGWAAPAAMWFPLVFMLFAVPLPSALTEALTGPLKQWISEIVVEMMFAFGYPIARSGVIISVGSYQLLVADACSGINSMVSLSALGLLFMYLMPRQSRLHNTLMLAALLPIAFVANVLRVVLLVLITYHLGDEAGQGFLHGIAGLVLSLAALVLFFGMDRLLHSLLGRGRHSTTPGQPPSPAR
jgi:exosortase